MFRFSWHRNNNFICCGYLTKGAFESGIDMLSTDKKNDLLNLIVTFSINNEVTVSQAQHACNFVNKCSDEMLVNFMNMIMETKKLPNIRKFHKIIGNKIVEVVNAANDVK